MTDEQEAVFSAQDEYLALFDEQQRQWVVDVMDARDNSGDCVVLKLKGETPTEVIGSLPKAASLPVHMILASPQEAKPENLEEAKALDEIAKAKLRCHCSAACGGA